MNIIDLKMYETGLNNANMESNKLLHTRILSCIFTMNIIK